MYSRLRSPAGAPTNTGSESPLTTARGLNAAPVASSALSFAADAQAVTTRTPRNVTRSRTRPSVAEAMATARSNLPA